MDSKKKLCKLVSEFAGECKGRKLRVNEGKSKVTTCWSYVNVRLDAAMQEKVDCKLQTNVVQHGVVNAVKNCSKKYKNVSTVLWEIFKTRPRHQTITRLEID